MLHHGDPLLPGAASSLVEDATDGELLVRPMTAQQFVASRMTRPHCDGGVLTVPQPLPSDALRGTRIGVSVAESEDLDRRGLLENHFREVLGELAQLVVLSGGDLVYGGDLRPDGYTRLLIERLRTCSALALRFHNLLAWPSHRKLPLSELQRQRHELGGYGEIVCLDPDGRDMDPERGRSEAPAPVTDEHERARSLTAMRGRLCDFIDAHLVMGGRRRGFSGRYPGIAEEVLLSLEAGRPVCLAAGAGGMTADVAEALGIMDGPLLPPWPGAPAPDPRHTAALERLRAIAAAPHWTGLDNGLTAEENLTLTTSRYPQEIAALVALGLGRLRQEGRLVRP
ncbi:hypothetical protein [Streptomyces regalis]|uniref:hypothetical protein n=1 Tax=Streptomyces regalis TaxID=68262 RepID=UPI00131D400B|nr:hypothetical protein [Streptomyces regalis]